MKEIFLRIMSIFSTIVFGLYARTYAESIRDEDESPLVEGELGEYFEGDMLLTEEQKIALYSSNFARNGLIDTFRRWPANTVVYYIEEDQFDDGQITMIMNAMADIVNNSCIMFRERRNDEYATRITSSRRGCFSSVGYTYDEEDPRHDQTLNLARGCFRHGTIVHEMLHTLGFYHMQSTYNRDDYVQIVWENIKKGKEHNFARYDNDTVTDVGVSYDYGSVLHYSSKAFSKNGSRTIVPLEEGAMIGQRIGMSDSDIEKLNRMYCENKDIVGSRVNFI